MKIFSYYFYISAFRAWVNNKLHNHCDMSSFAPKFKKLYCQFRNIIEYQPESCFWVCLIECFVAMLLLVEQITKHGNCPKVAINITFRACDCQIAFLNANENNATLQVSYLKLSIEFLATFELCLYISSSGSKTLVMDIPFLQWGNINESPYVLHYRKAQTHHM